MLQAATPASYFNSAATRGSLEDDGIMDEHDYNSDDDDLGGGKHRNKSRRELPAGAVATLKAWLLSPEHFTHPYPTPQDQVMLMQKTGIDKKQLKNWFTNARRRIWKPMLKKQLEQGKLSATGTGAVTMNGVGVVPGMMVMQGQMPGQSEHSQYQGQHPIQSVQEVCPVILTTTLEECSESRVKHFLSLTLSLFSLHRSKLINMVIMCISNHKLLLQDRSTMIRALVKPQCWGPRSFCLQLRLWHLHRNR